MRKALVLVSGLMIALVSMASDKGAAPTFEQLKSLAGTWEGKGPEGKMYTSTWAPVSGGSVMMERMQSDDMVTMYHLDGARLMMTHYCGAKNQPRMVAEISPDGKTISFNFLDATNLASPNAGHMRRMIMTLEDADHFSQQWFFRDGGKDQTTEAFRYTRKR
jgi:hypothetical protein